MSNSLFDHQCAKRIKAVYGEQADVWLQSLPNQIKTCEPAYEVGALLRNPHPEKVLIRKVALFADYLDLDPMRIIHWGICQAMLAACWSVEDEEIDGAPWLRCAHILQRIQEHQFNR